jgi:hypothetical protein
MKATITASNLYYNHSLLNYFFRTQSENEFKKLFESVQEDEDYVLDAIDNYSDDLDEVEEMFYNESIDEIILNLGLTSKEEEEE